MRIRRKLSTCVLAILTGSVLPTAAWGQFGTFEKVFDKLTDVNFYVGGNLSQEDRRVHDLGVSHFGVELMYNLGAYSVEKKGADRGDTVTWTWSQTEVTRSDGKVDTVYTYVMSPRPAPSEKILTFELGLGYGQIAGVDLQAGDYTVRASVREFPSASVYIAHRTALYAGLRSGLIQTTGLHAYDTTGATVRASATAFQFGGVFGYSPNVGSVFPFIEAGWMFREFSAIDWGGATVPPTLPRDLDVSGWQVLVGLQVSLKR